MIWEEEEYYQFLSIHLEKSIDVCKAYIKMIIFDNVYEDKKYCGAGNGICNSIVPELCFNQCCFMHDCAYSFIVKYRFICVITKELADLILKLSISYICNKCNNKCFLYDMIDDVYYNAVKIFGNISL